MAVQIGVEAPRIQDEQLLHACKMGGSSEIDTLLAAKADPNFQAGQGGEAPLHWAARKGLPVMVAQRTATLDGLTVLACLTGRQQQQQ